jgi:hypothetical protein
MRLPGSDEDFTGWHNPRKQARLAFGDARVTNLMVHPIVLIPQDPGFTMAAKS